MHFLVILKEDLNKQLFVIQEDLNESFYKNHQCEWFPKDPNTVRAISFFNLSVAHVVRGEIENASKHFNSVVSLI